MDHCFSQNTPVTIGSACIKKKNLIHLFFWINYHVLNYCIVELEMFLFEISL